MSVFERSNLYRHVPMPFLERRWYDSARGEWGTVQQLGNAIATLIAGGVLVAVIVSAVWRFRKGVGYWSTPATKFTRAEDPFSFWLSIIIPVAILGLLLVAGVSVLLEQWMR